MNFLAKSPTRTQKSRDLLFMIIDPQRIIPTTFTTFRLASQFQDPDKALGNMNPPSHLNASRTVYPPIQKLDKCCRCDNKTGLRLCSSCGEQIYCSPECQKEDWNSHKHQCKQTERIDLGKIWPFLAYQAEACRLDPNRPQHPATLHKILNKPIPNVSAQTLPNGVSTNFVLLGDPIPLEKVGSSEWWPSAISEKMRRKLFMRIVREGHVVPILLSICVALMAEMYTTTYNPEMDGKNDPPDDQFSHNKRFRLQCERNAIVDFGICKGAAEVKDLDTFGYILDPPDDFAYIDFFRGQDPKDHYWIYFKTLREEFILDTCMFTFNMAMIVYGFAYWPHHFASFPQLPELAGIFISREFRKTTPTMHYEKQRFSVLQNKALQSIVRTPESSELDIKIFVAFMERVAGRKTNELEQDLLVSWTMTNRRMWISNLINREFLNYPDVPPIGIIYDPGEEDKHPTPREVEADAMRYIKKWSRRAKKGEITSAQLMEAIARWDMMPPEEKLAWHKGHKKRS